MRWFVYFHDDYFGNGGVGFEEFPAEAAALEFINKRLEAAEWPDLDRYTLVKGNRATLEVVSRVQTVRVAKAT